MTAARPLNALATHGPVAFVLGGPEAHGYVVDTFCKNVESPLLAALGLPKAKALPAELRRLVNEGMRAQVLAALREGALLMAVAVEEPTTYLGYVLCEGGEGTCRVRYCYVQHTARRKGLGRALVGHVVEAVAPRSRYYAVHTRAGSALVRRYGLQYQPEE